MLKSGPNGLLLSARLGSMGEGTTLALPCEGDTSGVVCELRRRSLRRGGGANSSLEFQTGRHYAFVRTEFKPLKKPPNYLFRQRNVILIYFKELCSCLNFIYVVNQF